MIAGHIEDLIHAAKAMPKNEHVNSGISRLKDALAHFKADEYDKMIKYPNRNLDSPTEPYTTSEFAENILNHPVKSFQKEFMNNLPIGECICPQGTLSKICPVHGSGMKR